MDVIAVAGKGGTGKTTTVASLGHELARTGRRTVLLDLDGQASLTDWLMPDRGSRPMIEDALMGRAGWDDVLVEVGKNLLLAPTNPYSLLEVERHIEGMNRRREEFLGRALAEANLPADVLVLDTPRGLGTLLTVNVLEAAEHVLVTFDPAGMNLNALGEIVRAVEALGEERGVELLAGVVPTRVASNTTLATAMLEEVASRGLPMMPPVRSTVRAAECVTFNALLGDYAPDSTAAKDYEAVAQKFAARLGEV